jgi:hypothetical protein
MPVRYQKWITRADLQANPGHIFVFGDNAGRWGLGGQAKEMRNEPNALGVATLYAPGKFYRIDDAAALETVTQDLKLIASALKSNVLVVAPFDGLGTGLARLPEHAPALHNLIVAFFTAAPGEPCPWRFV